MKRSVKTLPQISKVPEDVDSIKLREFFNWKKHELVTRHEVDKILERFQKEIQETFFSRINESEVQVKAEKEEILKNNSEFKKSIVEEVKGIESKGTESLVKIKTEIDNELKEKYNDLGNRLRNSEERLLSEITKINDVLNSKIFRMAEDFEVKINNLEALMVEKQEKITEEFAEKNNELKNSLNDKIKDLSKISKDDDLKVEQKLEEFTKNMVSDKFESLNQKLIEVNTKFYEFKESNDMELIEKEFEKKTKELESSFKQFETISEGLNEEIKAEIKNLRDSWFPEFKEEVKQDFEAFKTEINEKFKSMDPNAVAQASEDRINEKIKDLNLRIEDIQDSVNSVKDMVTKDEFEQLHENFKTQIKKIIEWINYFDGKNSP